MLKLCPWKKNIIKHENVTISNEEVGVIRASQVNTRSVNTDIDVDFGNCSNYACPFYDEEGSVWCRRVSLERGKE